MKSIRLISDSEKSISLLAEVAKRMNVTVIADELTDEEMAFPGPKVSKTQLEEWLSKDDGEKYEINEAFAVVKNNLAKARKKKK